MRMVWFVGVQKKLGLSLTGVKEHGRGVIGVGVVQSVAVEPSVVSVGMVTINGISFSLKAAIAVSSVLIACCGTTECDVARLQLHPLDFSRLTRNPESVATGD
eukprot:scaffold15572_cov29-Attheya_sp.AAC.3